MVRINAIREWQVKPLQEVKPQIKIEAFNLAELYSQLHNNISVKVAK